MLPPSTAIPVSASGTLDLSASQPIAYASFTRRVRALVLDGVVLTLGLVIVLLLGEVLPDTTSSGRVLLAAIFGELLLYEPLMVWRFGGTLGHRWSNLRVVDDRSGGNPGFFRAFARYVIKGLLGVLSFVTMAVTRRYQAIHDSLTQTTVQLRDVSKASAGDYYRDRADEPEVVHVSPLRRVVVIITYVLVSYFLQSVGLVLALSPLCLRGQECTTLDKIAETVLGVLWLGVTALCIVAGWHGRLWGARGWSERAERTADPSP